MPPSTNAPMTAIPIIVPRIIGSWYGMASSVSFPNMPGLPLGHARRVTEIRDVAVVVLRDDVVEELRVDRREVLNRSLLARLCDRRVLIHGKLRLRRLHLLDPRVEVLLAGGE